jgi:hypothetical protein
MKRSLRNSVYGLLAGGLVGFTACSTMPKVQTETDSAVNFARYRTFAILPLTATGGGVDPGAALRLARPAEEAVRETLLGKGLTEAARDQADCAVLVRGESIPKVEVTNLGYSHAYLGRGRVYYPIGTRAIDVQTTNERRLIVEIYDQPTRRLAWVGWMERTGTGSVEPGKVQEGIRRILDGFPPMPKTP